MKILQVVTVFPPAVIYGGPSSVAAQQASALAGRGHSVTVATSDVLELRPIRQQEDIESELGSVNVLRFPAQVLRSHFSFVVARDLSSWLQECVESFDIVHVHLAREWIPVRAAQISLAKGVPTFLQPHGMLGRVDGVRYLIDTLWTRQLLERASGVLSLQEHEDNEIRRIAPDARIIELPNGIEPLRREDSWRVENLTDPVILFLARLHPRKRVLSFIEMASILRDRGVSAHYRVVGPDGGDLIKAHHLVRKRGLEDQVVFVGGLPSDAVAEEYLRSAVYVLPSVDEPFPMTVLEALSLGTPCVVTDTCFVAPQLIKSGAALVSSPDPEDLADAVGRILSDVGLAERLSAAGRRLIGEKLAVERVVDSLEMYYEGAHA
jgi:glycosyltransferase involved in cell wall biosynthesis